jgi:L-threonylcarbamoyladenylate synthase
LKAKVRPVSEEAIAEAAGLVKDRGLVVYPTDTVYGLGCDPLDEAAVARLFEAKGRSSRPIPIICSGLAAARRLGAIEGKAAALAQRHWPGALTIVVPAVVALPRPVDQGSGEIGVRVPASEAARSLAAACGGWLAGTSANISGEESCRSAPEAASFLGDRVDLILDGGRLPGRESTVVRAVGGAVEVLRQGAVSL